MNKVIEDIKKEIKNETVVVATSGGPDSKALVHILKKLEKENNLKIIVAHVNHKLRKESETEAKDLKQYCMQNNLIFEYTEINKYKGNTEGYARKKRYEFFEKILKKYHAKYLLTAHHADDLMETILMRISKGLDISTYVGFSKISKRKDYKIYRPLIYVTKEEILAYNAKNKINYAVDKTNENDTYTRNRFRKYVLPPLKKENKNIHKNFIKFSEQLSEYEKYINKIVSEKKRKIYKERIINLNKLNKEEKIIKKKILYEILKKEYKNDIFLITEKHIESILDIIKKEGNLQIDLPQNKVFIKNYAEAQLTTKKKIKSYDFILYKEIKLPNNHIIKQINKTDDNSNNIIKLNSKNIILPLHVRTKKDGDKMEVKGLNGRKKIKDIFIDSKIPAEERKIHPIVTDDEGKILWIPGIKKSNFDESNDENYDIIVKYF